MTGTHSSWNITHGLTGTTTFNIWATMKARCLNANKDSYHRYGGRGISVCDRWLSFENFLEDMGERPEDMSIERLDNDGNYEPSNCKWVTNHEQSRNKANNRWLEYQGERLILTDWSEKTGLSKQVIHRRLKAGWSVADTLAVKVNGRRGKKGSENSMAKLTEETVGQIKKLLLGSVPSKEIAKMYKLGESTISGIKHGHRWSHVEVSV